MRQMRPRHVFTQRGVYAALVGTHVACDAFAAEKHLDGGRGIAPPDLVAERGMRDAVVVLIDIDDRECREDADLDRGLELRTRRHRQKAIEGPSEPLRNATDPEPDHVRANPLDMLFSHIRLGQNDANAPNQMNLFQ